MAQNFAFFMVETRRNCFRKYASFLAKPFALNIQHPIDFSFFKLLINGTVANDNEVIYPF